MRREKGVLHGVSRRSLNIRRTRFAVAIALCFSILCIAVVAGAYFLFTGRLDRDSALVARMETAVESLVGEQFAVEMPDIHVDFSIDGKAYLEARNIKILKKSNQAVLAEVISMRVESNLTDALSGSASFDFISIEGARVNANVFETNNAFFLPAHLNKPLDAMGAALSRLQQNMREQGFRQFSVRNLAIEGQTVGRLQKDPIVVESLLVEPTGFRRFQLTAELSTDHSNINLISRYERESDGLSAYEFQANGIGLREWLHDPEADTGIVASNGMIAVSGRIGFRKDNTALDPSVRIVSSNNGLRVGKRAVSDIKKLDLNFRLILARNQIELDPSEIEIGRLKASLIGGVKPHVDEIGYEGPLLYDIIMRRGEFVPTIENEPVTPAGFKLAGLYDRETRILEMNDIVLTTKDGAVEGSGEFDFNGETPALKGTAVTSGISVVALKQYWPFFIADGARNWIHDHILGGRVIAGTINADIPPGIIFRIRQGAKLKPEHFKAQLEMEDVSFYSFGEMPPIENGKGYLTLEGMQIKADLTEGQVLKSVSKPVDVKSGTFILDDFGAKVRHAKTKILLAGDARSLAGISDLKPLRVMDRIKVSPTQFSGAASADVAAEFPIKKGLQYEDVNWNLLLETSNANSSKPIEGRNFSDAHLVIDANPTSASVIGKTNIDGVPTTVRLVEPIGKSGKVSRKRTVTALLDNEDRSKLGIDLGPVVDGPVAVNIQQRDGFEAVELDFENAELALPWIGWRKGKKIPAKATFRLNEKKGRFSLEDFKLKGAGFEANGSLIMSREGLISANMTRVSLNEGDDLTVAVRLDDDVYHIDAVGAAYDARGVMTTLIYDSSFAQAQGTRSVELTAKIDFVRGFGNRSLRNANLDYLSERGRLILLELQAQDDSGNFYSVDARRSGNQTQFAIQSRDAGNALAFADIYTHMQGGTLTANLIQKDGQPFLGPVQIRDFVVVNEPRLERFASSVRDQTDLDGNSPVRLIEEGNDDRVRFSIAGAQIEKGPGYLKVNDAIIRNPQFGMTATGLVYDQRDRINMNGTFMAANMVNTIVSSIPLLGNLLSDNNNPFIGITYRLSGQREDPTLEVNPLSIVAPGLFKKIFEFNN